jgi:hypothetical protein
MTIKAPSTYVRGQDGRAGFRDVDFKTKQDLVLPFTKLNKRYRIKSISIISKDTNVDLSNGATVVAAEASTGADTDATITLTSNGTAPADGVTVTVGGKVYTFQTTLTNVDGNVLIGSTANAAAALDNLKSAVNLSTGAGTTYATAMTAHPKITATTNTDTTQVFVASVGASSGRAGNDLTGADTSATLSWSNSGAFTGGLDGVLVNAMVASTDLADTDQTGLVQNLTLAATAEVLTAPNAVVLSIRTGSSATTDTKDVEIEYTVLD